MRLGSLVVLGLVATAGAVVIASCGGGSDTGSGSTTGGDACAFTDPVCTAVKSDCIALVDNAGKDTFGLRMAELKIQKPAGLQMAQIVIDPGIMMNLMQCRLNGQGVFSWLLQFDKAAGTIKTGGANPVTDPTKGYCFINGTINGTAIAPITLNAPLQNGMFSATQGIDVTVPIFVPNNPPILLPLKQARITQGTLSADQNCIGHYNSQGLDPVNNCVPDNDPFTVGGSIDGYITIDDAQKVAIPQLGGKTLCYLLNADASCTDASGAIVAKGDWCAATNKAADATCADAYALGAQFAASAVTISGECPPANP